MNIIDLGLNKISEVFVELNWSSLVAGKGRGSHTRLSKNSLSFSNKQCSYSKPSAILVSNFLGKLFRNLPGTHANKSHLLISPFQLCQQSSQLSRACGTRRMPKGDCSAIGIHFFWIQSQGLDTVKCLTCKGFVEFEDVHILEGDSGVFKKCRNRVYW